MLNNIWTSFNFKDYLEVEKNEINKLPDGVAISTMCASAKLGTKINIDNIEKYLPLNSNDILTVKRNISRIRTLIPIKIKKRRNKKNIKSKKNNNHFYNQITVVVRIYENNDNKDENLNDVKKINIKIFKNGSIQMSGVKQIEYANRVLNKLIFRLKQVKAKIDNNKINEINFIENEEELGIFHFKIDMINSNYRVNLQIDRDKLYNLLLKKKIKSSYEKCIRACVIIKYTPEINNPEEKEISIFVFQKGNIIITGARTQNHIISSYKYINNIFIVHGDEIQKKNEMEEEKLIMKLYNTILKENSHKLEN